MSDFLFASPSLIEAVGRNIDLFGVLGDYNDTPVELADRIAFATDIASLYDDATIAFKPFKAISEKNVKE